MVARHLEEFLDARVRHVDLALRRERRPVRNVFGAERGVGRKRRRRRGRGRDRRQLARKVVVEGHEPVRRPALSRRERHGVLHKAVQADRLRLGHGPARALHRNRLLRDEASVGRHLPGRTPLLLRHMPRALDAFVPRRRVGEAERHRARFRRAVHHGLPHGDDVARLRDERLAHQLHAVRVFALRRRQCPAQVERLPPARRGGLFRAVHDEARAERALRQQRVAEAARRAGIVPETAPFPVEAGLEVLLRKRLASRRDGEAVVHERVEAPVGQHRGHIAGRFRAILRHDRPYRRVRTRAQRKGAYDSQQHPFVE